MSIARRAAVRERAGASRVARRSIGAAGGSGSRARARHDGAERGPGTGARRRCRWRCRVVLLVGAGLFVRTLQNLHRHDSGIDLDRVVIVRVEPRGSGQRTAAASPRRSIGCTATCWRASKRMPGVRSASLARSSPLGPSTLGFVVSLPAGGEPRRLHGSIVYPRYFATMGMPIVQGPRLQRGRPAARTRRAVVIVNEAFVREILDGPRAARERHGVRRSRGPPAAGGPSDRRAAEHRRRRQGLARSRAARRDAADGVPDVPPGEHRLRSDGPARPRRRGDSADDRPADQRAVQAIDRDVPMASVHTLADEVDAALVRERLVATLVRRLRRGRARR